VYCADNPTKSWIYFILQTALWGIGSGKTKWDGLGHIRKPGHFFGHKILPIGFTFFPMKEDQYSMITLLRKLDKVI